MKKKAELSKSDQLASIKKELDMIEVEERLEIVNITTLMTGAEGCCWGNGCCNNGTCNC